MATLPRELNIISLNCWGLKFISKSHRERLLEIGKRIASTEPAPNIVGLQECWTQEDYRNIRQETKGILPYGKFYHSGIFGGGLAILSKWPIEESSMVRYPLNGRPNAFYHGDWYVGKGVACARLRIGPGQKDVIEVFTTHLHAPYEPEPNDSYMCHRTAQAWEIAKLMRGAVERGHFVIGLGDFNMIPLSLAHRIVTVHGRVNDIWRTLHPDSSVGSSQDLVEQVRRRPIPTASYNFLENGATCDSVLNTWRWDKSQQKRLGPDKAPIDIPLDTVDPRAKRLDYIFTSGSQEGFNGAWVVKAAEVGMMERHPILQCSLSDHFSVQTTIVWQSHRDDQANRVSTGTSRKDWGVSRKAESEGVQSIEGSPKSRQDIRNPTGGKNGKENGFSNGDLSQNQLASPTLGRSQTHSNSPLYSTKEELYLPIPTYNEVLIIIAKYAARERKQRQYRLYIFITSVFVSIGCLTAIWWSPRNFIAFLLILLSTLGLGAGIVNGLIGGLFVGSELRALKEFEWEIRNARAAAGYGAGGGDVEDEGVRDW